MISSLLGSVIMSGVTVAMLIAIKFTDKVFTQVGRYPLTKQEMEILRNAGFNLSDIENINQDIKSLKFNE